MNPRKLLFPLLLALASTPARAGEPLPRLPSSTAFCLFEVPAEGDVQRLVNLGIVQYMELSKEDLRVFFGGGNLGSGHETSIRVKSRAEGLEWVARMQATAHDCARAAGAASPKP